MTAPTVADVAVVAAAKARQTAYAKHRKAWRVIHPVVTLTEREIAAAEALRLSSELDDAVVAMAVDG